MPKRKRHLPGKYKLKNEIGPNFTGPKPLTLFQGENGLWGAKDREGNVEIEAVYQRIEQTEEDRRQGVVRLAKWDEVICVSPDDWDVLAYFCPD